ncbi:hypothetical protein DL766_010500 [Monosporascus sp. MC13-8B]|nr:hypothetical protein DL763_009112 [Monosporascus cannonballus]RYP02136.1 hypothetical protein DL766_010500 [Monosporascus sp. MC13-8B]
MTAAVVDVKYLSAGANRHTAAADWSEDGVVAFGAGFNIALWRPNDAIPRGITNLLPGHRDVVKAVKFLPRQDGEAASYLLSGADDRCLKVWRLGSDSENECVQTVQSHTAGINCIAALKTGTPPGTGTARPRIFATGAADATVRIWSFDGGEARVLQTIKPSPKFFPLALALSELGADDESLVLAAAGTRDIVQIFVADSSGAEPEFRLQATLSGHEGWIRSLDFTREGRGGGDLILASASQDKYIRLWRFHAGTELPTAAADGADPSMAAFLPGRSPSNKAHRLKAADKDYSITFEALLLGHDDWIYSAKWCPRNDSSGGGRLQLLSTSADNTLAIWKADSSSGIWVTTVRLGEISREKGATTATGSTGGFWTGLWSPDAGSVACLGRTGSWRLWGHDRDRDQWLPRVGVSGHTRAVTGVTWARSGDYLLSTSADQTTRLHAAWVAAAKDEGGTEAENKARIGSTWHEMARPQIHGYDLNCIDTLGDSQFVSGADEKLMRVFDEPRAVARLLNRVCGIGSPAEDAGPDAADMPVLGLSNKAVEAEEGNDNNHETEGGESQQQQQTVGNNKSTAAETGDPDAAEAAAAAAVRRSALDVDRPPLEDALSRHTLWPEAEKLYGHGYELSCLACSHDGRLVASACRASSANHAVVRLFEAAPRWSEVRPPLAAHSLTATRLRFSPPDDRYLLSVGRDRAWAVFERAGSANEEAEKDGGGEEDKEKKERAPPSYRLLRSDPKGHSRMILDAAWAPPVATTAEAGSPPPLVFATAGRDKQVKIWRKGPSDAEITCAATIPETHPATAIDFLPRPTKPGKLALAVGTEAGKISVHLLDPAPLAVSSSLALRPE